MWTTKNGKQIAISDMHDKHLQHTISMLSKYKKHKEATLIAHYETVIGCMHGEMAIDSIERILEDLYENGLELEDIHPLFPRLLEEAEKRA